MGFRSIGTGLAGYKTLKATTSGYSSQAKSYMGRTFETKNPVLWLRQWNPSDDLSSKQLTSFVTVKQQNVWKTIGFPWKKSRRVNTDEPNRREGMIRSLKILPQPAGQAIFERVSTIRCYCGPCRETEAVPDDLESVSNNWRSRQRSSDNFPIPYISPYNVGAFRILLVSVMAEGYLYNLQRGSIVERGTIITHPCTDYSTKNSI